MIKDIIKAAFVTVLVIALCKGADMITGVGACNPITGEAITVTVKGL